jgi:hypothetical protein
MLFVLHSTSLYPGRRTGNPTCELGCVMFLLKGVGRYIGRSIWLSVLLNLSLCFCISLSAAHAPSIPEIKIRMFPPLPASVVPTPGNTVLTKLIVTDMVNVSDAFYAVRMFVAAFTKAPVGIPVVDKCNIVTPSRSVT